MIVVRMDVATVAKIRLAASPLAELAAWLRLTVAGRRHPVLGDPGTIARQALRDPDIALVAALVPSGGAGYMPDFLTPKPHPHANILTVLAGQLEQVEATTSDATRYQLLVERFAPATVPVSVLRSLESDELAHRAASGLAKFWKQTLADRWTSLHSAIEAEIAGRLKLIGSAGVGAALDSLHPSIHWNGAELVVDKPYQACSRFADTEVVLSPSVLSWPPVLTQLCDPANAVLGYATIGAARRPSHDSLVALLGAARSTLLADLDVPRSTKVLSERHHLAPGTVSYHLRILHDAGLVRANRVRREVLYQRTGPGDTLILRQ